MLAITATDLPRFMICDGSAKMGGSLPSIDGAKNTVKDEGNAADWVVKQVHKGANPAELVGQKAPNGVFITEEMIDYLEEYLSDVMLGEIEVDTTLTPHRAPRLWQVNGRADLATYNDKTHHLDIADLKYGWSVVEPADNWTLISHALGWLGKNPDKPVSMVTMSIYQPRVHHPAGRVRSVTLKFTDFIDLYKQIDEKLSNPSGMLQTSPLCKNCPAVTRCPAYFKASMNALEISETAFIDELSNDELSFQLDLTKRALDILTQKKKAYDDLALHNIRQGQIVKNYALETGLSNRAWKQGVTPDFMKMITNKDLAKDAPMVTPAAAERAGVSKDTVKAFTERHSTGIKLVRVDADTNAKQLMKLN